MSPARTLRVTRTALAALLLGPILALAGPSGASLAAGAGGPILRPVVHQSCAVPRAPRTVHCLSLWRHGGSRQPAARTAAAPAVGLPASGYGPPDIVSAYQLDTSTGAGQTIGIVDAFDNPQAEADLAAYRDAFGLPPCTTANGCFHKVNQDGGTEPADGDPGWGVEIDLDLQAVSASCPNCSILLVEADEPSIDAVGAAVNTAVRLGADVVSNSYGTDEFNGVLATGATFYTHPGVAQVASSGDFGFGPASFPAVYGTMIAAGGTTLVHNDDGSWSETAWFAAGSGCSAWVDKPAWQHDDHCLMRTVTDVAAVADNFAVYDTYGLGVDNGWIVVGGTSISSPLLAGMIGLAGNAADLDSARYIYDHSSGLADVVGGSNGYCGEDYLCTGVEGYDGPTGLGTPRGTSAL